MTGASALLLPDPTVTFPFYSSCLGMPRTRRDSPVWPLTYPGVPIPQNHAHIITASLKRRMLLMFFFFEAASGDEKGGMERKKGWGGWGGWYNKRSNIDNSHFWGRYSSMAERRERDCAELCAGIYGYILSACSLLPTTDQITPWCYSVYYLQNIHWIYDLNPNCKNCTWQVITIKSQIWKKYLFLLSRP